SKLTFYRRFAILLDFIFSDIKITLNDGEIVSESTKMAMGRNVHDVSNFFGRRIDLLLTMKDIKIELSSNEWKPQKTEHPYIKQ
ncbi:hypothetical protein EDC94DRAFT_511080, partial [Helicostylum pulchrum]